MDLVKLAPAVKSYIWGGKKLVGYGKKMDGDNIAETWELSFNDAGPSIIASGENKGKALKEVASKEDIGSLPSSFPFFPTLIKFIDSASPLSVQVHPSDAYALAHEGQLGKTEMWHILEHEKGAGIYLGLKKDYSYEELEKALKNDTILDLLNFFPVENGESYFIPSGTIHAIGKGVTLIEIQQNSTLTYRLYDYNRVGSDGKKRELHIDKALKVINLKKYEPIKFKGDILGECEYFVTREKRIEGESEISAPSSSFLSISFMEGEGSINGLPYKKGDTFFLPAGKKAKAVGKGKMIVVDVEKNLPLGD